MRFLPLSFYKTQPWISTLHCGRARSGPAAPETSRSRQIQSFRMKQLGAPSANICEGFFLGGGRGVVWPFLYITYNIINIKFCKVTLGLNGVLRKLAFCGHLVCLENFGGHARQCTGVTQKSAREQSSGLMQAQGHQNPLSEFQVGWGITVRKKQREREFGHAVTFTQIP